ncbi:hypothetical protein [Polaromonas sp.]|uniref:hypothetical protein n=1 Tax=Polaromonas sp. TaxID=1869339 RepID=UPI00352A5A24
MSEQWRCETGSSLLIPSGPDAKKHLFALMLEPTVIEGYGPKTMVLMACVSSVQPHLNNENACLLSAGEHPFIAHDSFVDYRFTRLEAAEAIEKGIASGVFVQKEDCAPALLKKIIAGALASRRISREHKQILERVLFD